MLRLLGRNTKSGGGHIDISLLECASAVTDRALVDTLNGLSVYPNRTDTDYSGDFKYIRGLDGWILAYLGRYRDRVAEWLESEYPAGAQGLRAGSDRIQGLGEGIPYIDEWVGKTSVADVFKKSQALRLPWASVESNTSLTRNPQHRARGFGRNRRVPWKSFYARPLVASGNARDSKKERAGPLSGLRVLDFSWVLAGPYASRMLADAGADIIKVQTRAVAGTLEDTATPYFRTWNRGKRGITLDLSQPGGVNLARSLIEQCDAVIESFSPRVMANWGIKPVEVCRKHPGLVWLSMSSFGATGPWRDYVSFAQTTQALSGLSAMNMDQKGRPRGVVFSFADHISGILGTIAILGALLEKQRTGHGQWIDFSQFEAISLMMGNVTKGRLERAGEKIHHYCRCAGNNRWCVITLDNLRQQESFYNLLGNKEGAKNNLRPHRMSGLMQAVWSDGQLSDLTSRLDAQKLAGELQKLGIAAGAVQDASDMLLDRQLIARGCFPFKHGKVIDNLPSGLFGHNDIDYRPAPVLGQDNFAVFRELLGMQDEEIQSYIDSRVIG
jgi:crotonobetainyl-CoA:carnitine CoA-transferase CaiB-like acyl-CoA transferase